MTKSTVKRIATEARRLQRAERKTTRASQLRMIRRMLKAEQRTLEGAK
jgi:hypothetical protein